MAGFVEEDENAISWKVSASSSHPSVWFANLSAVMEVPGEKTHRKAWGMCYSNSQESSTTVLKYKRTCSMRKNAHEVMKS